MELTHELKVNSGLQWVLTQLSPLSPFGKQSARALPWYIPGQEDALEAELNNIALALPVLEGQDRPLRELARCLSRFNDVRGSLDRDLENPFDLVELFELKHFLVTLEQLEQVCRSLPAFAGVEFLPMEEALDLLDPDGRRLPAYSVPNSSHPELGPLREAKTALERTIRAASPEERPALLERRRALAVREEGLELEARRTLTHRLLVWRADFLTNMTAIGRLDLIFAKTRLARRYGCVRPELNRIDRSVTLRGLRHPEVAADLEERGETFTPVDLELGRGCTVITGANMGGKTVSLRAAALSQLLFQCGFFVFAAQARLPLFRRVDLILADSGPGSGGLSSFGREVWLLDRLLRAAGEGSFLLALDEFARGTNPQEGAALARALVRHLGGLDCAALLTTHYDGVSDAATAHYQVAGLVREANDDVGDDPRERIARRMDYRLLPAPPGAPCPRDALRVCRLLDVDPALLALFSEE